MLISLILINYRITYSEINTEKPFKVTTWDAFGYYLYLPSVFIYHDITQLKWLPDIDKKYQLSGGNIYQANLMENGNNVFKYLGGVSILELPFFIIGHIIAINSHYAADGFSPPYQYALSYGILCYFLLALFLLRNVLLRYFSDLTTLLTLLLVCLASNAVQYAACDSAQSHIPIFFLYAAVLYTTIRWHEKPTLLWASLTGYIIGLATISRPTEAIMFLIPLLWNTHTKEMAAQKWALLKTHKLHLACIFLFGIVGIFPQLLYWKITTGKFIYDVGSKWTFLNPFFRVLFGFEKGWFIYTPVTIFFVAGLFFVKPYPFKKSVWWFCLLNIYIIISWFDWRYGGSYSTRALVQSYPVFALPLAALIEQINLKKWRYVFYGAAGYMIFVNLFQIWQYNNNIIHYDHMNRLYYGRIYLNSHPSPLDVSLLDTDEWLKDEELYSQEAIFQTDSVRWVKSVEESYLILFETPLKNIKTISSVDGWLKIEAEIKLLKGDGHFNSKLQYGDSVKLNSIRLLNPITHWGRLNNYAFYVNVPSFFNKGNFTFSLNKSQQFDGSIEKIKITYFRKK